MCIYVQFKTVFFVDFLILYLFVMISFSFLCPYIIHLKRGLLCVPLFIQKYPHGTLRKIKNKRKERVKFKLVFWAEFSFF